MLATELTVLRRLIINLRLYIITSPYSAYEPRGLQILAGMSNWREEGP